MTPVAVIPVIGWLLLAGIFVLFTFSSRRWWTRPESGSIGALIVGVWLAMTPAVLHHAFGLRTRRDPVYRWAEGIIFIAVDVDLLIIFLLLLLHLRKNGTR